MLGPSCYSGYGWIDLGQMWSIFCVDQSQQMYEGRKMNGLRLKIPLLPGLVDTCKHRNLATVNIFLPSSVLRCWQHYWSWTPQRPTATHGGEANSIVTPTHTIHVGSLGELSGHQCWSLPSPFFLWLAHPQKTHTHTQLAKWFHSQSAQDGMCESRHPKENLPFQTFMLHVTSLSVVPRVFFLNSAGLWRCRCRKLHCQPAGIQDLAKIYNFLRQ